MPNIDTVGACIGQRGARIKNIVDELNGERIDIVEWKPVVEEFVSAVLSPAVVSNVTILEDGTAKSIGCTITIIISNWKEWTKCKTLQLD